MSIRPHYVIIGIIVAIVGFLVWTAPSKAEDCPIPLAFPAVAKCADVKNGAPGRDADIDKAMAVGAASSLPVWLGDKEQFAVSGGLGFTEGETAVGATGVVRIGPAGSNFSAFAGGAISTEDSDAWAGKAGGRIGF